MGRNYYLSSGHDVEKFYKCNLEIIFKDKKSLEDIDLFTSLFTSIDDFKRYLYENGLIDTFLEDVVIAYHKTNKLTNEKKLVPIYLKRLIFKNDLNNLEISGSSYKEWASELYEYIKERKYDKSFIRYILSSYLYKYESSESKSKAPILTNGDIYILLNSLNKEELTTEESRQYDIGFANFFLNELYKCQVNIESVNLNGRETTTFAIFKPIDGSVNEKGLHDMLVNIIEYLKVYKYQVNFDYAEEVDLVEDGPTDNEKSKSYDLEKPVIVEDEVGVHFEEEEFFEARDFERPLIKYAKDRLKKDEDGKPLKNAKGELTGEIDPLDLNDPDSIERDDRAMGIVLDQAKLLKKRDGME